MGPAERAHEALKLGKVPDEHRPIVRTWLTRRARLMDELSEIDDQLATDVVERWHPLPIGRPVKDTPQA